MYADSDADRQKRLSSKSNFTIAVLGWIIIGSTLNSIIFSLFPIKLLQPEWQLSLVSTLLSSSIFLLIGAALVTIACLSNAEDVLLLRWQIAVCRMASLLSILLILVMPLQFFLGSSALNNLDKSQNKAISNLQGFSKGISDVNSEPQLRAYVASLPNPPALPAKFDVPFAAIKQRAITNIQAQINAALNNFEIQKKEAIQVFLKESIRNTAQAILMATAFAVLASLSASTRNAFTILFERLL